MSYEIKKQILDKIKEYSRIILCRHIRPDGDAVGSTKGLARIISLTYPEKEVYVINSDEADYMAFLGAGDPDIADELYRDSLCIVCDTASEDRISNPKYSLAKELIKIDHHINISPYGDISWVEEEASSLCELIADFYITFEDKLKIDKEAATYIYAGMVTDSGRFRFNSTSPETLRRAAKLLEVGIDTDWMYSNLYISDFSELRFKAKMLSEIKVTENGVAYLHVTGALRDEFGLTLEAASNVNSYMDSIKGSLIWLAFIDQPDGDIRVRLRSRFVTINSIAERHSGGGHACAAGATVHSLDEMAELLAEADAHLAEYKAANEGWL